jgi:tRNA G18 (ribose-2'-O)-methylase SpoU
MRRESFERPGVLLFGNESSGLSAALQQQLDYQLAIPGTDRAESLNVAISVGITLDRLKNSSS